jgi:hypothetical protein
VSCCEHRKLHTTWSSAPAPAGAEPPWLVRLLGSRCPFPNPKLDMLDKSAPALSESTKSRKAVGRRAPSKKQPRCPGPFRLLRLPTCVLDRCSDIATEIQIQRKMEMDVDGRRGHGRVGDDD